MMTSGGGAKYKGSIDCAMQIMKNEGGWSWTWCRPPWGRQRTPRWARAWAPAWSRACRLSGLLGTSSDGGVLLHLLLGDGAHLPWPLGALGVGGVARGLVLTLLFDLGGALNNIVLNVVNLLLGPALGFVLGPANLRSLDITILDKGGPADLGSLVEGDLLVLDETALPEILFAVLLLLGLIVRHIGGVTPPVIGVVALDDVVVLSLLNHLDLVDTSLAVSSRSSSSNSGEAHVSVVSLTLGTSLKGLDRLAFMVFSMVAVMITMSVVLLAVLGVEGEGVGKGPLVPCSVSVSPQGTSSKTSFNQKEKKDSLATRSHIGSKPAGVNTSTAPAGLPPC